MKMTERTLDPKAAREPVLSPVDRVSEMLFGLFMALSFVGALSVAEAGRLEIQTMLTAAVGCNLAWGLVDAVMYLVRTVTDRGRSLTLIHSVRQAPDAASGRRHIESALSQTAAFVISEAEVETIRARIVSVTTLPTKPTLQWDDLLAAVAIFVIVVASTFPVVLPFMLFDDVAVAKNVSRIIALTMLFFGGAALGRYAGYGSWKAGCLMAALGTALLGAIMALGG